jgi:hypothetical protein
MITNPPQIEPLASIAAEVAKATEEIRVAWVPMAEAGIALAKHLRGSNEHDA